ncbi:EF-P 5-aminopentanol modification-associated protein YfmF [Salipaludibacillus sp. CF4.18]|uniref:EF-P 5-aminopentanol modification-associated protein YfmF n=1 Tax=Salipaludibacillus sp. CF4.18 TaxID=3373081 RepID=UPI003EE65DB8
MNQEPVIHFQSGSINVHYIPSTTFKTNTFVIQLKAPLAKDTVTKRAILPQVLQSGSEDYPTRLALRSALEDLYGASLQGDIVKKGENQIMSFRMDIANEKFLKDNTPLMEQGLKLLSSVFLHPKISNNQFDDKILSDEIRTQRQKLASIFDDKMRFANKRLTEEMCKNEPFGLHVLGEEKDLDAIDSKNLFEYYQQVLQNDQIDFYIMGDMDHDDLKEMIEKYFMITRNETTNTNNNSPDSSANQQSREPREVVEEQEIQQGKLHLGYRTNVTYGDQEYFALQLFNGIFGGFSHSKLFINVREKASLAYYAASRIESMKGLLIVMAGIESNKYDEATSIIFKQMEDMQNGEFTEEDIEQTKAVFKNQILETMDSPRGRIELEYQNEVGVGRIPLEEWMTRIDEVTKEDIVQVASKIQLDTTYFLKGKEESANE